jgi:hypothetical protein
MPSALLHPPLQGASAVAQVAPAGGAPPVEGVWFPVVVAAIVTPTAATLTTTQKAALATSVRDAISGYVNGRGVGERIVQNRLVRDVMAIEGVYDVSIDVKPRVKPVDSRNGSQPASSNLDPPNDRRPTVAPADLTITVAGAVIALDVSVRVVTVATEKLANVREEVEDLLDKGLPALTQVTEATLRATLDPRKTGAKTYGRIDDLSYRAEFLDEGLRVGATNKVIEPADGQQLWIRQVLVSISGT